MTSATSKAAWTVGILLVTSFVAGGAFAQADSAHTGFTDKFESQDTLNENYDGDTDSFQVNDNEGMLQVVDRGKNILVTPDADALDLAGDRLLEMDLNPVRTVNSGFYSTSVNVAELVNIDLGDVLNGAVKTIELDMGDRGPDEVLRMLDENGNVIDSTPIDQTHVPYNEITHFTAHVDDVDSDGVREVQVTLAPTDGNEVTKTLETGGGVPAGTVGFSHPSSNTARVLWDNLDISDTPATPTDVVATSGPSYGEITVDWNAPEKDGGDAITKYQIYHSTEDSEEWTVIGQTTGDTTEKTFERWSYTSTQTHYFKVSALNDVGESPLSDQTCNQPYPAGYVIYYC